MRQRTALLTLLALATAATLTASCGKKDESPPAADSSAIITPPAPVMVATVELGKSIGVDKRVGSSTTSFARSDTIYASVATTGSGPATLGAEWKFQDGQVVDQSTQSIVPTGPAVTEFHVSKPTPWPAGKYTVTITLNGAQVDSKEFEIK
jgi:hypothetical protein